MTKSLKANGKTSTSIPVTKAPEFWQDMDGRVYSCMHGFCVVAKDPSKPMVGVLKDNFVIVHRNANLIIAGDKKERVWVDSSKLSEQEKKPHYDFWGVCYTNFDPKNKRVLKSVNDPSFALSENELRARFVSVDYYIEKCRASRLKLKNPEIEPYLPEEYKDPPVFQDERKELEKMFENSKEAVSTLTRVAAKLQDASAELFTVLSQLGGTLLKEIEDVEIQTDKGKVKLESPPEESVITTKVSAKSIEDCIAQLKEVSAAFTLDKAASKLQVADYLEVIPKVFSTLDGHLASIINPTKNEGVFYISTDVEATLAHVTSAQKELRFTAEKASSSETERNNTYLRSALRVIAYRLLSVQRSLVFPDLQQEKDVRKVFSTIETAIAAYVNGGKFQ
jgi:hypothetical protein